MNIEWLGHSCFKLTLHDKRVILFDPFGEDIGFPQVETETDILIISHDHYDHNCTKGIRGNYVLFNTPGELEIDNPKGSGLDSIKITGIEQDHDKEGGKKRGKVLVSIVEAEGIRLMHMSDIGVLPDEDFYKKAGKIDILMIPVGGVYTIDANEAIEICKRINPNIILPMHYKTLFLQIDVEPIFMFSDKVAPYFDRSRLGASSFNINADSLKKRSRVIVMDPSME